ncbi:unnamed protein product [Nezara viridula]|uniref:Uncharacterized protein n=1 Tax=Nezara viridula TaxID=85310 RepID=A0A9P0H2R8_NEZVI|nr:unnamed protein product [Nezara viridula]
MVTWSMVGRVRGVVVGGRFCCRGNRIDLDLNLQRKNSSTVTGPDHFSTATFQSFMKFVEAGCAEAIKTGIHWRQGDRLRRASIRDKRTPSPS